MKYQQVNIHRSNIHKRSLDFYQGKLERFLAVFKNEFEVEKDSTSGVYTLLLSFRIWSHFEYRSAILEREPE